MNIRVSIVLRVGDINYFGSCYQKNALKYYEGLSLKASFLGIEGFKHRQSVKMQASQLFLMKLPSDNRTRTTIGLVNANEINLMEAIMDGNKFSLDDVNCHL